MATKKKTTTKKRPRGRPRKKRPAPAPPVDEGETLNLGSVDHAWPDLSKQFEGQLKSAVSDCRARPLTTAKRKVTVVFELKPDDGDVVIAAQSKVAFPPSRMEPIGIKVGRGNQLLLDFNRGNDADLLDDDEDEDGGAEPPELVPAADDDWGDLES